jgi:hypothetical protein
MSLILGL